MIWFFVAVLCVGLSYTIWIQSKLMDDVFGLRSGIKGVGRRGPLKANIDGLWSTLERFERRIGWTPQLEERVKTLEDIQAPRCHTCKQIVRKENQHVDKEV